MQCAVGERLAPDATPASHGGVRARCEHLVHPGARVGRPSGPELHQFPARFQREVPANERSQLGTSDDHVAAGQKRIKRSGAQQGGYLLEGLDGDQGDGRVQVRGLAEEPVADDALPATSSTRSASVVGTSAAPSRARPKYACAGDTRRWRSSTSYL